MKKFFLLLAFLGLSLSVSATPPPWGKGGPGQIQIEPQVDGEKLILFIHLPAGSHLYSATKEQAGPQRTKLFVNGFEITAPQLQESPPQKKRDETFGVDLWVHTQDFTLTAPLIGLSKKSGQEGFLLYQICDNLTCSLPQKAFFKSP